MGDKSPKSVHKKAAQKQVKVTSAKQKKEEKEQADAEKQAALPKK
jgi:hypothetical protein